MGYETNFYLTIHREGPETSEAIAENHQIFKEIEETSGYDFDEITDSQATLWDAKWYDAEEDIASVAEKYPDVIIEVIGEGEDREDNWTARFKGNKQEKKDAEIMWPEFTEIILPEEDTPKARYQRFQEALKKWLDYQESFLKQHIIGRLKESSVDLTEYPFGQQRYFFISAEESLYCHKAELDKDGKVVISAGLTPDPEDNSHSLEIDNVFQDVITLNDFMDCIYDNIGNCLDED